MHGFFCDISDMKQFFHLLFYLIQKLLLQFVIIRQHFHPFWHKKLNLTDWKFVEYAGKDSGNIFSSKLLTICRHCSHTIFFLQISRQFLCFFFIWKLGVYKYQEWFTLFFQKIDCQHFCTDKVFSRKFAEASVCGDHQSNRGMLLDHFSCAGFCSFMKWNCLVKPRCFYHTLFAVFYMTAGVFYQKSYAVDQADPDFLLCTKIYFYRFFWNEFGFYCRDQFTGTA